MVASPTSRSALAIAVSGSPRARWQRWNGVWRDDSCCDDDTDCRARAAPARSPSPAPAMGQLGARAARATHSHNLDRERVQPAVAMKITGHKTASIYRRYRIVEEDMREALERVETAIVGRKVVTIGEARD